MITVPTPLQTLEHIIHIDDRQILFANLLPLRAAGDAGDDAVAVPAFRNRRALLVIARIDQQMPMRVLFGVVRDAANHAAAPARFRFDQHGHVLDAKLAVVIGWWIIEIRESNDAARVVDKRTGERLRFTAVRYCTQKSIDSVRKKETCQSIISRL